MVEQFRESLGRQIDKVPNLGVCQGYPLQRLAADGLQAHEERIKA